MNDQIKKRWVAALRSGKYKQNVGTLKSTSGKYCCLGVLCELYSKEHEVPWQARQCFMGQLDVLPFAVAEWAGLGYIRSPAVMREIPFSNKTESQTLGYMNDRRVPFRVIADLIEEQL